MGFKIQESARSPLVMSSPLSSPSFNSYSSSSARLAEIAARVVREVRHVPDSEEVDLEEEEEEEEEQNGAVDNEDEEEFEFCFVQGEPDLTADEMFDNGQIRPLYYYPVFDTRLLLEAQETETSPAPAGKRMPLAKLFTRETSSSSSSSEVEQLELGADSGSYCLWNPNEKGTTKTASSRPKKSNSTGSASKRWKLKDLLLHRSNSERKEQEQGNGASAYHVVLFHPNPAGSKKATGGEAGRPVVQGIGMGDRRRSSYLPYRHDLVGFFSNVNGLSRNLHPF